MNIELKPHTISFTAPASANDNAKLACDDMRGGFSPARRRVVIYRPAKSAMTSGRAGGKRWLLEFEPQSAPFIEPLMGWTGSADPTAYMRLKFPSREAAIGYAERQGSQYEVRETAQSKKPDVPAAKSQAQPQPMALWPVEAPVCDWSDLLIAEVGSTVPARDLAA